MADDLLKGASQPAYDASSIEGLEGLEPVRKRPGMYIGGTDGTAARAGAVVADAEFIQFHPTALDIGEDPAPLATEALRGEGAVLRNREGSA